MEDMVNEPTVEIEALRSIPFFAALSEEDLESVLRVARSQTFDQGQAIVEKGDTGDAMYVIVEGRAQVDVGGRYHDLRAGAFFGEMALITEQRRMATVKAVEPVQALVITAEDFRQFLLQNPTVAVTMLRAVLERLREVQERIDAWMGTG